MPTLAALAAVALFVTAGNWQHRRMHEKQSLEDAMLRGASVEPVPLPANGVDWRAWRFRRIVMTGQYDARRQILIDNKVYRGRAGFDVVTPLDLPDGRAVLVDRGWIAAGRTRAVLPDAPPPTGTVTVRGRIDLPPRYFQLGDREAPSGPLWEHLDPARFAQVTGVRVPPIVIEAEDAGSDDALVRDWSRPDTGVARHLSYMIQWYTFAAMAAGLWAWFTFRRKRPPDDRP